MVIQEFPSIEATRCLLTETEMGMRLSVNVAPKHSDANFVASFSSDKSLKEEWYVHFDVVRSNVEIGGKVSRCVQLRHCKTNQYLHTDDKGRITCVDTSSESTWWFLEQVVTTNQQAPGQNGLSSNSQEGSTTTNDQYTLISRKYPLRRLCSVKGFEGSGEEFKLIASKNTATEASIWTLNFTSGELCYILNPVVHHSMRCNIYGGLSLTSQPSAWEIYRFIEAGDGELYISSWIHFHKFLSSNADGEVFTADMVSKSPEQSERWRLEKSPMGNGVYIRNVSTCRYLSVGRNQSEHLWTTTKPNEYALWHFDAPQSHTYYITSTCASTNESNYFRDSNNDVHVSSNKEGPFLASKRESDGEWKVEVDSEGYFTFFSKSHEKYLGCNSKGDVHTTTSKGAWTLWKKETSSNGGAKFQSKEHNRYLAVSKTDNTLKTTSGEETTDLQHSWRLDPVIPRLVTGGTAGYLSGAMGLSETMPFAMLGALEASQERNLVQDNTAQRPICSWKSWFTSYQSSSPSHKIVQSNGTTPSKAQKADGKEESVSDAATQVHAEDKDDAKEEKDCDDPSSDDIPEFEDATKEEEKKIDDEKPDESPEVKDEKESIKEAIDESEGDII